MLFTIQAVRLWKGHRTMPLRREGDRIEKIDDFDAWIQDTLTEAIERGEFDNLPQAGKPIKIERNPYQPELDMAFSRMKNAGTAPAWIELDREIHTMQATLDQWLQATAGRLAAEAARIQQLANGPIATTPPEHRPWHQRWWPFRLFADIDDDTADVDPDIAWQRWRYERKVVREQYLDRAGKLDDKIELFNNSVPRDLWHLEKLRLLPEKAEAKFETACPAR